jgi:molybdenum cofactor cytidylyltransferase
MSERITQASPVAAVVLAAGGASRMGQPKQLLDWGGKPMVRHVVEQVRAAGLEPIVVLGCQAERVSPALEDSGAHLVVNADWEQGLGSSLRAGLAAVPDKAEAVAFVHADQPKITSDLLAALVACFRASRAPIVLLGQGERRGPPVLFARALFDELAQVQGDEGGRALIQKYAAQVRCVQVQEADVLNDIDTWQEYEESLRVSGLQVSGLRSTIS